MERVRFLDYAGKNILFLDFTNCTPEDVLEIMEECRRISARDFLAFDSNEEALAWLVEEESDAA